VVAALQFIGWLMVGGLGVVILLNAAERYAARRRQQNIALARRLETFELNQRVREQAVAQRSVQELNALAYHAYERMIRASIEALAESPQESESKGHCR
jgi:hypothetical protein